MALINRIALHLNRNPLISQRYGCINLIRPLTLKSVPAVELPENHDERNAKLKRPQSPHLTVYAPQLTSMLSISHRFTDRKILVSQRHGFVNLNRPISLKKATMVQLPENYDKRNAMLKRPLSPHLAVYSLKLTGHLSIMHRFTGIALAGYTVLFGLGAVTAESIPSLIDALAAKHIGSVPIFTGKFIVAFPLSYHFWNGIRHLFWDMGKFLTIKEVYSTGYIMLTLTVVSSIGLCLL